MKLAELLSDWTRESLPDCEVRGLENNSRQVKPGDLFCAYPGALADGRLFISQAVHAGASAVLYEPNALPEGCLSSKIPCIPIDDLSRQLGPIANRFYQSPSKALFVTGITGTNGKTTIAYLLAQAYTHLARPSAYIGTLGEGMLGALHELPNTTPDALCLQKLLSGYQTSGVQAVCMEVSSHALSQNRVDSIEFDQAIYTNLSHEHLDFHQTMAAYAEAKASLFSKQSLKTAIVNQDDAYVQRMVSKLPRTCEKLTYGLHTECDVQGRKWRLESRGSEFEVDSLWGTHQVRNNLPGLFNIYNSLAVMTCLFSQGFSAESVISTLSKLQTVPGRMEVVIEEPCTIVDFAHTPDALENLLSTLDKLKQGRLLVVFGCGGDRDKEKRPIMGRIAGDYADILIITSDNPRTEDPLTILSEIEQGVEASRARYKIVDRKTAIEKAISLAEPDDVIVIAGKGHETDQQIGHERFAFSDQAVVRSLGAR